MSEAAGAAAATDTRVQGTVRIVGTGLLGTSIALGLRARGVDVVLADASPTTLRLAADMGAGRIADIGAVPDRPSLVVVCVPPDVTARVVAAELAAHPSALVTDVASVKAAPLAELAAMGADLSRYLGSHPLAGRERGGPVSATGDLFLGRPWVIAGHDGITYAAGAPVEQLILDLGAVPIEMTAEEHDASVALVSHVPQVVASLLASRLADGDASALGLSGQGLRDTTRIASSDAALWVQILGANASRVVPILKALRTDLDDVIAALDDVDAQGARLRVAERIHAGNAGVARIPGKHGQDRRFAAVIVMIDDRPGQLAALISDVGAADVSIEDLRLEHSQGAQVGLVEIAVLPEARDRLVARLDERDWRIAG
ncbi:prephenate dehydrogenase [Clavibacter nebraskensis]|nr:prephenate dehydrogenase [Clavibacter nebraskensis]QGV67065.1 prephenate dehydrogenase [Clavibacter nebraskensis]